MKFVKYVCDVLTCRARRSEARIQLMLWKVSYSDIVFVNTVCMRNAVTHCSVRIKHILRLGKNPRIVTFYI